MSKETSFKKPMLAVGYKEKNLTPEIFVQPKMDGIRCMARFSKNGVTLWSRGGKIISSVPHIVAALDKLPITPDLDGELYCHGMAFSKISGICRHKVPWKGHEEIEFWIYDSLAQVSFRQRLFCRLCDSYKKPLVSVPTINIEGTHANVIKYHDHYVEHGYEGLIIRLDSADPYKHGRSKNLIKFKDFVDEEYTVLAIELGDPEKGLAGHCTAVWCEMPDGRKFKAKHVGDREFTLWMAENPEKVIGQKVTVKYKKDHLTDNLPTAGIAKGVRWDL